MRQKIRNSIAIRVHGMNLSNCTNLKFYISQDGTEYEYTPSVSQSDSEVLIVTIPKADAMNFNAGLCKWQVALTDSSGLPRSHEPVKSKIGELLWEAGYGT